ncbi:hypothetical protein HALDL1_14770 [Halobacterium sp. DL1]|jgi:hypothetical protein|nr:hypothetical protein HALDL1_14770 [Halobacterium sp. DL1]
MSHQVDRRTEGGGVGPRSGLEALRQSPAFQGPVEPLPEGGCSNDHLALIYEGRGEQFDAAVPFVQQGLDADEQCLYIADEHSRADVLAEMSARGIDVDAALDSGALSVLTKEETYLRDGSFHPDDMLAFLEATIADATEEFEALRVTGEMTWVFGDEPDVEDLVEYEAKLNQLLPEADGMALCQYNRERFSPEVVRDIVRTHPYLVHGTVVSQNVYYSPPEEFFGPEQPANETDRMLRTLRERSAAKAELQERERYQRTLYELAADTDRSFEEKLQDVFELGCERFDLELGGLAGIDTDTDFFEVEAVSGDHDHLQPGARADLSETYCRVLTDEGETASVTDPVEDGFGDARAYEEFEVNAYLGTRIGLADDHDRSLFFVSSEPKAEPFSEDERTFHHLMGQWCSTNSNASATSRNSASANST